MAMTVNEKYVKEWLNKLPGFDPLDPKPGHYHIFLCPETGMVFKAREETKDYTKKTGITDFLSIWAEVKNGGDGKWSIGTIDKSAPDAAATKNAQQAQDEWDRQKHAAEKAAAEEKMRKKIAEEKEREAKEKAAQDMKAAERIRYEREKQEEQDEKDRIAKEELRRHYEEDQTVTESTTSTSWTNVTQDVRKVSDFENAYGKWVNDKLTRGGHPPIKIDQMLQEFYDGTVLRKLLTCLTESADEATKRVDMRPHNRFVVSSNYQIMWPFMEGPENIDLAGINAVNIWGNHPMMKTLLNLIHKLQMKYDNEGGRSSLLEWCKPRCAKNKSVNNFGSDWSDGTALLALYDSHFHTDLPKGTDDENIRMAFKKFNDDLGVVPLLDPQDLNWRLAPGDNPEEKAPEPELVAMYIASIKNAMEKHSAPAPVDNLSIVDDLYEQALASTAKHSRATKENSDDTYTKTISEFNTVKYHDKDQIHDIISRAVDDVYQTSEEGFSEAHDLYDKATEILDDETNTTEIQEKKDEINKSKKKSDALPLKYRKDLYERLLQAFKDWERDALMRAGKNKFDHTCTTTETFMTEVYEYIDREFEDCTDEKSRIAVKNNAVKMVVDEAGPGFELAIEDFNHAKDLCDKNTDKMLVDNKVKDVNDKMDEYKREVEYYVSNKVNEMVVDEENQAEDMLQVYHQFSLDCAESINCLRPVGQLDDMGDDTVPRRKGAAQYRLDKLLEVVKKSYERDCALREQLHIGTDALFNAEKMPL
jgi:hypothetical protein